MTVTPAHGMPLTNWAGNVIFSPARAHRPTSLDEVRRIVSRSAHVRVLGSGHSFNRIADTPGDLLSLAALPPLLEIDSSSGRALVGAGMPYGAVVGALDAAGFALHNLGSLPHISIAGACATGTHGSGDRNRVLAAAVSEVELVTGTGDVVRLRRGQDGDRFEGAVLSLGALGVITTVTLDLQPSFDVAQTVYEGLPLPALIDRLDEVMAAGYSVSVFSALATDTAGQIWVKRRVEAGGSPVDRSGPGRPADDLLGVPAGGPRNPVPGADPAAATRQLGEPGPWHSRLPHFRLEFTPSSGEELQSEYLVPRGNGSAAVQALRSVRTQLAPLVRICELRTVAADDLWLSPAYGRDCLGLHLTWVKDEAAVARVLPLLEDRLTPLQARPHWAKVFTMDDRQVAAGVPRLRDFAALAEDVDPGRVFRNDFVDRFLRWA